MSDFFGKMHATSDLHLVALPQLSIVMDTGEMALVENIVVACDCLAAPGFLHPRVKGILLLT